MCETKGRSADVRVRILLRRMKSVQNTHRTPLLHWGRIRNFGLTGNTTMDMSVWTCTRVYPCRPWDWRIISSTTIS